MLCGFIWVSLGLLVHWAWKVRREKKTHHPQTISKEMWLPGKKDEHPKGFYHKLPSQTIRRDLAFILHTLRVVRILNTPRKRSWHESSGFSLILPHMSGLHALPLPIVGFIRILKTISVSVCGLGTCLDSDPVQSFFGQKME